MANAVLDSDSGKLLEYRHLTKHPKYNAIYGNSSGNEVGRITQGIPGRISKEKATNTMFFINSFGVKSVFDNPRNHAHIVQ